ncbi:precorrin-2 dehydrogenase/sirohydrochlorin ferrochelatase family protein [Hippea jasoniae]|uniref:precorrin-2 dehydrogenase/sirohydrochlorin ferrochelatase family protein n=1 Tax=Hippea jasoniae TaxID=944479 RepID=UPI0009FF4FD7|nr:bifunctional precorrin-2 dehydrogenase/sirohydrochlorin ferrochelatase [Hippea jasoniae]
MVYPFVFKLSGKKILFIGGGRVAKRKIMSIISSNPFITIIADSIDKELTEITSNITIIQKKATEDDITNNFDFIFICTNDYQLNRKLTKKAKKLGIPVNVADNPQECDFFMPAVIEYKDFLIAVSSKGKNPSEAKKLKEKIEKIIRNGRGEWI